jgi:hypothetical protein
VVVQTIDLYDDEKGEGDDDQQAKQMASKLKDIQENIEYQSNFEKNELAREFEQPSALDPNMVVKKNYERMNINEKEQM